MSRRSSARAAAAAAPPPDGGLAQVFDAVLGCKDAKGRKRCELFLHLPEKTEPPVKDFPEPADSLPEGLAAGSTDKLASGGTLPNMNKKLPSEDELRKWTRPSQVAFWEQRRAFYNRMRMSELQRECRMRSIWPGGEMTQVKDRLLRFDCCPSELAECELQTEEDAAAAENDIGVIYYQLVKNPIDLGTIEDRMEEGAYKDLAAMEADLRLLFANARSFDAATSDVDQRFVTDDANALEAAMDAAIEAAGGQPSGGGGGGRANRPEKKARTSTSSSASTSASAAAAAAASSSSSSSSSAAAAAAAVGKGGAKPKKSKSKSKSKKSQPKAKPEPKAKPNTPVGKPPGHGGSQGTGGMRKYFMRVWKR